MSDYISRQAAIDAIHEDADWLASQGSDWQVERMERDKSILRSLPSAHPSSSCAHENDTISRTAAIERIESHIRVGDELYPLTDTDKILNHAFEIAASCVYNLPPARPERNRGKWIDYANSHCECSVCHTEWSYFQNEVECFEFCPNCGADMREVDE